jgi:hypothetical protein
VTATQGATTKTSMLSVSQVPVINEIDYSVPHATGVMDPNEFIELYNPWSTSIALDGLHVVLTRMTGSPAKPVPYTYDVPLTGMMAAGSYIVIANQAALTNFQTQWTANNITNATGVVLNQPDGWFFNTEPGAVGIFDANSMQVVNAFGYKTPITASPIMGYSGTFNFAENTSSTATLPTDANWTMGTTKMDGSLIRNPNGQDTGDFAVDLKMTKSPTPGTANVYTP